MVSTPEAVKEVLLMKSVAYAGRPQTRAYYDFSLGTLKKKVFKKSLQRIPISPIGTLALETLQIILFLHSFSS